MKPRGKATLVILGAITALAMAASTASATRLEFTPKNARATWSSLIFSLPSLGAEARCPLTLEGTFHGRIFRKISGQLIGYLTRAHLTRERCTSNGITEVTALQESLPWHVRYDSFQGTLPTITGVRLQLIGASFLGRVLGTSCLYASTSAHPLFSIATVEARGVITGLRIDETRTIPSTTGGACGVSQASLSGSANVTALGSTERVRIRLAEAAAGVLAVEPPVKLVIAKPLANKKGPVSLRNAAAVGAGPVIIQGIVTESEGMLNDFTSLDPNLCHEEKALVAEGAPCVFEVEYIGPEEKREIREVPGRVIIFYEVGGGAGESFKVLEILAE